MNCGCRVIGEGDLLVKKGCTIHDTEPKTEYSLLKPSKIYQP